MRLTRWAAVEVTIDGTRAAQLKVTLGFRRSGSEGSLRAANPRSLEEGH